MIEQNSARIIAATIIALSSSVVYSQSTTEISRGWIETTPSTTIQPTLTPRPSNAVISSLGLLGDINRWSPYIATSRQREAAERQADQSAKIHMDLGEKNVIISVWQSGGVPNGTTITPVKGIGIWITGSGATLDAAIDKAIGPALIPEGASIVAMYAYSSSGDGTKINKTKLSLSDFDKSIARGRTMIDADFSSRLAASQAEESQLNDMARTAPTTAKREEAARAAENARNDQKKLKDEHERRLEARKEVDAARDKIIAGTASPRDHETYSDEFDRFLRDRQTALCSQHADNCNPCTVCIAPYPARLIRYAEDFRIQADRAKIEISRIEKEIRKTTIDRLNVRN